MVLSMGRGWGKMRLGKVSSCRALNVRLSLKSCWQGYGRTAFALWKSFSGHTDQDSSGLLLSLSRAPGQEPIKPLTIQSFPKK